MSILVAAVTLVGLLALLNLILMLGVLKRLREHTERLAYPMGRPSLSKGAQVGEFAVMTVDGESLCREQLSVETLVGFFSPTCGPCKVELPRFVEFARTFPGGRSQVLAAVIGTPESTAEMAAILGPVARVVIEETGGALSSAFQAQATPVVLTVIQDRHGRLVVQDDDVKLDRPSVAA
ncbi:TlpA family protein disulfide reductase [Streptomyces chrestomyceticus]|uniref:TlpA family protein disulfide reductase n=1 Tax=Streptomyces chrestomyceticus TaxID=68185 RepID=UPI0035A85CDB